MNDDKIQSEGTSVLIDPEQPVQVDVSVGEAPHLEPDYRWLACAVLLIDWRRVWINGYGPSRDDALQALIRAGTEQRVAERRRTGARLN